MKFRRLAGPEKVEQQMAPMLAVAFLLLTLFVVGFRPGERKGDFYARLPLAAAGVSVVEALPPIRVRLVANQDGTLAGIRIGERQLRGFAELTKEIVGLVRGSGAAAENVEIELDCDYGLHYDNVLRAISAVSGYTDPATHALVKLVDKIKFAPPHAP